jgi:plastocyanin domain-containing protein
VVPSEKIRRVLPLNQEVSVDIRPMLVGELAFTCGMDMLKGTIVVQ